MAWKNIRIAYRLVWGFGLMLALMAGITAIAVFSSTQARKNLTHSVNNTNAKSGFVAGMRQNLFRQGLAARNIGTTTDLNQMQQEMTKIDVERKGYKENEEKLAAVGINQDEQAILTEMHELGASSLPFLKQAQESVAGFNAGQALKVLTTQVAPIQDKWLDAIDRLVALQNKDIRDNLANFEAESTRATISMVSICGIAMLSALIVALLIGRSITGPLKQALHMAKKVASGDLTNQRHATPGDETGQLLSALFEMNESLVKTVGEVRDRTQTITVASREIASGNADLSSRTESQASSLEETASSMEELTATVKQNADHAQQANQLVESASTIAATGGQIVSRVVDTMGSIKESSRKIVDIISVIDGIAFQTNILALNAAVEAARAGEQGRGFAVVAAEVRNLAQRSAGAAKEIKTLIGESVGNVDAGSKLVDEAGSTMGLIVDSVKKVANIMTEISEASREQSVGIEEVNRAITQMDEMTQQNAAMVEQAAAATESLEEQAQALTEVVHIFKLNGSAGLRAPASNTLPAAAFASRQVKPAAPPKRIGRSQAVIGEGWEQF